MLIQVHDKNLRIDPSLAQKITGTATYGGIIFNHFGHFMLETLARAWYLRDCVSGDIYFYYAGQHRNGITFENLTPWQKNILGRLVPDTSRIKIINSPILFDELTIPDAAFVIREFCAKAQVEALSWLGGKMAGGSNQQSVGDKIWLSRSALTKGAVAGEKKFEEALNQEGFQVVHPEKLPLADQIAVFEKASIICGFTGSAFHVLLFAKNKSAKLMHFSRTKHLNRNYPVCAEATGCAAEYYNFYLRDGAISGANGNVLQDLPAIWGLLYSKNLVKTPDYEDLASEADLERLDNALRLTQPQLFK
jgi:capsular polysaccharide biosynthesis protein